MKNILVTGGAGYIGSHTAKALSKAGYQPVTLDNLSTGHEWAVKWGPLVCGDLNDTDLIVRTLREYDIDSVIHFAASAYVGDSVIHPRHYYQNNIANSLNLLDAMLDAGVSQIVFSSSCATYGHPQTLPIAEDHPQNPLSPYGDSKYFVERAMKAYRQAYGLKCVSLRYFNAAGADPDGELGELHSPETHLIPSIIEVALGTRAHVRLFGTDYDTHDGTCVRDFIHVSDLAQAHVLALEYVISGNECAAFNLGTGTGHSVREVLAVVESVSDHTIPVQTELRRPGDAAALVADPTRAMQVLGWSPEFPSIERIVTDAWTWHQGQQARQPRPLINDVRQSLPSYAPL